MNTHKNGTKMSVWGRAYKKCKFLSSCILQCICSSSQKGQQSHIKIRKISRCQSIGRYLEKEESSQVMESAGGIEKIISWDEGWQD